MLLWCLRYPAMMSGSPNQPGFVCLVIALAMATAPLLAFMLLAKGSDPVHPRAMGAALGAAAGAWGALGIGLHCPYAFPAHVALGHVLPVLLLAGIGALAGGRLVGVRAQAD